jgi:hypothetical protein
VSGGVVAGFEPEISLNVDSRKHPFRMWAKRRNGELVRTIRMGEEELMSPSGTPGKETSRHSKTVFIGDDSNEGEVNVFSEWLEI